MFSFAATTIFKQDLEQRPRCFALDIERIQAIDIIQK